MLPKRNVPSWVDIENMEVSEISNIAVLCIESSLVKGNYTLCKLITDHSALKHFNHAGMKLKEHFQTKQWH